MNIKEFNENNKLSLNRISKFNLKYNIYEYSNNNELKNIEFLIINKRNKLIKKYHRYIEKIQECHQIIKLNFNDSFDTINILNFEIKKRNNLYKYLKSIYKSNKEIKKVNLYLKDILFKYKEEIIKLNKIKETNDL